MIEGRALTFGGKKIHLYREDDESEGVTLCRWYIKEPIFFFDPRPVDCATCLKCFRNHQKREAEMVAGWPERQRRRAKLGLS